MTGIILLKNDIIMSQIFIFSPKSLRDLNIFLIFATIYDVKHRPPRGRR